MCLILKGAMLAAASQIGSSVRSVGGRASSARSVHFSVRLRKPRPSFSVTPQLVRYFPRVTIARAAISTTTAAYVPSHSSSRFARRTQKAPTCRRHRPKRFHLACQLQYKPSQVRTSDSISDPRPAESRKPDRHHPFLRPAVQPQSPPNPVSPHAIPHATRIVLQILSTTALPPPNHSVTIVPGNLQPSALVVVSAWLLCRSRHSERFRLLACHRFSWSFLPSPQTSPRAPQLGKAVRTPDPRQRVLPLTLSVCPDLRLDARLCNESLAQPFDTMAERSQPPGTICRSRLAAKARAPYRSVFSTPSNRSLNLWPALVPTCV